jgi:hypothetical protein
MVPKYYEFLASSPHEKYSDYDISSKFHPIPQTIFRNLNQCNKLIHIMEIQDTFV